MLYTKFAFEEIDAGEFITGAAGRNSPEVSRKQLQNSFLVF